MTIAERMDDCRSCRDDLRAASVTREIPGTSPEVQNPDHRGVEW
jgi:hypothetical protein